MARFNVYFVLIATFIPFRIVFADEKRFGDAATASMASWIFQKFSHCLGKNVRQLHLWAWMVGALNVCVCVCALAKQDCAIQNKNKTNKSIDSDDEYCIILCVLGRIRLMHFAFGNQFTDGVVLLIQIYLIGEWERKYVDFKLFLFVAQVAFRYLLNAWAIRCWMGCVFCRVCVDCYLIS